MYVSTFCMVILSSKKERRSYKISTNQGSVFAHIIHIVHIDTSYTNFKLYIPHNWTNGLLLLGFFLQCNSKYIIFVWT